MRSLCRTAAMKRRLIAVAWSLFPVLFTGAALAEPLPEPQVQAPACPAKLSMPTHAQMQALANNPQDRGLLWRITDGERSSWLYGTIHVAKWEWMIPGRTIIRAMYGADKLALELNVLDPEVSKQLMAALLARKDAPELAAGLVARLERLRQQACKPELVKLRPEAQLLALLAEVGRPNGLDAQYGVDRVLAGMARGMKKPVIGLETVQIQLDGILSDDPQTLHESVSEGLQQLEDPKAPQLLNELAQMWAEGNESKLENYADWCDCTNTERQRAQLKRLMDDRNVGMAEGIVKLLQEGQTVFAAVGALHLVGPQGLPALLRKKGYKVERVKFEPVAMHKTQEKQP